MHGLASGLLAQSEVRRMDAQRTASSCFVSSIHLAFHPAMWDGRSSTERNDLGQYNKKDQLNTYLDRQLFGVLF